MPRILGAGALAALALMGCADSTAPSAPAAAPAVEAAGDEIAAHRWGGSPRGATVYVGHGINGRDLGATEALPVDIAVNGNCTLKGFTFRSFAGPLALPAGEYTIAVSLASTTAPCSQAPVIGPATVTVKDGDNATIFAHLTQGGAPTASVFVNEFAPWWRAQIAARHAAAFSAVDVVIDGGTRREITVPDLTNGKQVSTAIRPGRHTVALEPAGTGTPVFRKTLWLRPGFAYYAYAVGTPAKGSFEVLLQQVRRDAGYRHDWEGHHESYASQGEEQR